MMFEKWECPYWDVCVGDVLLYSRGQKQVVPPGISGQLPPETVGCAA